MNKFEQEYLNIINEWNSNLLLEANLKSLIPNIQQQLIGNKSYNNLNEQEKLELQNNINKQLNDIETKVNNITDNKQYQSWIYNILKNKKIKFNSDMKPIFNAIFEFNKLIKRPDIKPNQKNIQNYNSLNDLQQFIDSFKEEHNLSSNIYKNLKKIYKNEEFTVYFINKDQYEECNKLFGTTDYFSTGWCITKNKQHFDQYINKNPDKFNGYFVFIKDNKPYALLHYGSKQFKDDSNKTLRTDNPNIIDCLIHINSNINDYTYDNQDDEDDEDESDNDLKYYTYLIFLKENPNSSKEELIALEIGGEYDPKTKTIDCKGNTVQFKDEWLNKNGTFDFNLINIANNRYIGMFSYCYNLKELPNNFIIPNDSDDCLAGMFCDCTNLTKLHDNFIIPNGIKDCDYMFIGCENLKELPDNFTIPSSVKECDGMFAGCKNLTKLPDNFSIPKHCNYEGIFKNSGLEGKYNIKDLLK